MFRESFVQLLVFACAASAQAAEMAVPVFSGDCAVFTTATSTQPIKLLAHLKVNLVNGQSQEVLRTRNLLFRVGVSDLQIPGQKAVHVLEMSIRKNADGALVGFTEALFNASMPSVNLNVTRLPEFKCQASSLLN